MLKKRFYFLALLLLPIFMGSSSKPKKIEAVKIKTEFGDMIVYLYDATPIHKANFLKLAKNKTLDGTTFHRIIQTFMIQGGDPNSKDNDPINDGEGGPPYTGEKGTYQDQSNPKIYTIDAEINPAIIHRKGTIAAARMGDEVNPQKRSSGSQFYIVQGKTYSSSELDMYAKRRGLTLTEHQKQVYTTVGGTPHLDGSYTVFGELICGIEVMEKIAAQPKDERDRPLKDIKMTMEIVKLSASDLDKKYHFTPQIK